MKDSIGKKTAKAIASLGGVQSVNPFGLSKISGKKPKPGKVSMGPTKVTSTLAPKGKKKVAKY